MGVADHVEVIPTHHSSATDGLFLAPRYRTSTTLLVVLVSPFLLPGFEPGCTQVPVGHVVIFWVAESNSSLVTECDQEVALSKPEDNDAWKRLRRVQVAWAHVPILYSEPGQSTLSIGSDLAEPPSATAFGTRLLIAWQ